LLSGEYEVAVNLRTLSAERQIGVPAYLLRTRFERALLALAAEISARAYGTPVKGIRRDVVERYMAAQLERSPTVDDLLRRVAIVYVQFIGFTDVGNYSEDAQHPRISQAEPELLELCELAEGWLGQQEGVK